MLVDQIRIVSLEFGLTTSPINRVQQYGIANTESLVNKIRTDASHTAVLSAELQPWIYGAWMQDQIQRLKFGFLKKHLARFISKMYENSG